MNSPIFVLHHVFQIITITKFHENIVSSICLNSFIQSCYIQTLNGILIVNFSLYKVFFLFAEVFSFNYFAGIKFSLRQQFCRCYRGTIASVSSNICFRIKILWKTMGQVNNSILTFTQMSIQINQEISNFFHLRGLAFLSSSSTRSARNSLTSLCSSLGFSLSIIHYLIL